MYELLVVELCEDGQTATVTSAGFATDELSEAQSWADAFNGRELQNPMDSWGVIRVREPADISAGNAQPSGLRRELQTVG